MSEDILRILRPATRMHDFGLFVGPLLGCITFLLLGSSAGLDEEARRLAGVTVWMAIWWVSEAVPLSATALLPIVCFPILNILSIDETTARYGHRLIFLFMGGLMLGKGLERWGAHQRIALLIILFVGTQPRRIVAGVMISAAILSGFVSNTATAMMMLPIVISIGVLAAGDDLESKASKRYSTVLLLALAYGSSIGGIATLTGTPPNGFLAGFLQQSMDYELSYSQWLRFGVPMSMVLLPVSWVYLVFVAMPVKITEIPGGRSHIRSRLDTLGPMGSGELRSVVIFGLTALMWIFHTWIEQCTGLPKIDDASIAIGGALLMFIIPADNKMEQRVLNWDQVRAIPWGILILFGGGLALAKAVTYTGLDTWIGQQIAVLGNPGELPLLAGVTTLIVFMTEITSNTATTSTMLPVLAAVADGIGIEPAMLLVATAVSASCAFMLPVATPPNAIVFSSGRITIKQMALVGFGLNIICIVITVLMVWFFSATALGLASGLDSGLQAMSSVELQESSILVDEFAEHTMSE